MNILINPQRVIRLLGCYFAVIFSLAVQADTVAYRLSIARNDAIVGGEVYLDLQMRITDGTVPRTLHSFTLDFYYSSDLAPTPDDMATGWAFGVAQGYRTKVAKLGGYYRALAAGQMVNEQGGGTPAGWLLTNTWQTIVRLKWIIQNVAPLNVTVNPLTACGAYFVNLANQPRNLAESYALTNEGLYQPPSAVELATFSLSNETGAIVISWSTLTEENNLGFNIYRSSEENGTFSRINDHLIEGKGFSTQREEYSYRDRLVTNRRWYYYKLEQVDRDGATKFYGPEKIFYQDHSLPDHFYLQQNFPNPFNEETIIEYGLPNRTVVEIMLMNMKGEVVRQWPTQVQEGGRYRFQWDGKDGNGTSAPSGVYFLVLRSSDATQIIKLLKLK